MLCQISQIQPLLDLFGKDTFQEAFSEESFV